MRAEHPVDYAPGSVAVVPLADAIAGSVRPALYVLSAAVGFVLLIACANVANLLLARSLGRQREIALRAALGAGRARSVRQLMTESVLLSAIGAVGGVLLAIVAVKGLSSFAPVSLPRLDHVSVDGRVLLFTTAVALITGLLCGIVPAFKGSSVDLRGWSRSARARSACAWRSAHGRPISATSCSQEGSRWWAPGLPSGLRRRWRRRSSLARSCLASAAPIRRRSRRPGAS